MLAVAVGFLAARRLTSTSWPLQEANVVLVLGASAAYLASFVFRALGWQRLFPGERPDRSRCLAACGAAAASGVVLPFRLDYVVKISTLRRLGGVRLGLETVGLSIVTLGLVDAVAMLPLAVAAIATSGAIFRAPLVVVLLFCLGCIAVLALGPGSCCFRSSAAPVGSSGSSSASVTTPASPARRSPQAAFCSAAGRCGLSAARCS